MATVFADATNAAPRRKKATKKMVVDSDSDEFGGESESDFDDDDMEVVAKPPPKKKAPAPKAAAPKKAAPKKKKAASDDEDDFSMDEAPKPKKAAPKKKGGKTIEETYQKKTQLEHILLRPDTYIGSIEQSTQPMWVLDASTKRIVRRPVTYVPGLFKIFDEIMVNAADNKQRDPTMTTIKVEINREKGTIAVANDGKGIPVQVHAEHGCYVPELIFGHLLTGSNFDDDEKKTTGGRNGYGAKLANIFSTSFTVETADSASGQKLSQTWVDNMARTQGPAKISSHKGKKDFTRVEFAPDLKRFKMDALDDDIVALLSKRAYDVAASASCRGGLKVELNGERVPVKSFKQFVALHDGLETPAALERLDDRWTVGVAPSDGTFTQLSFVNSICTSKGGCHVDAVAKQVCDFLAKAVKKKNKGQEVKPAFIKAHLCVYVDALIVNPAFDSQTKETLTTKERSFGSKLVLPEKFLKAIEKSGVVDRVLAWTKFKQDEQLKRKGGSKKMRLTGITKLDDANCAGGAKGKDCTLILTEGDSAKALAVSGLGVIGRDLYGVFPLKGKPLNVREASHAAIMKNEEVQNVVKIMGLRFGTKYDRSNISTLRYGHLMIMTDQDHDGSHIKGLLINCFHHFWPSLLQIPGFLRCFITPIVKATATAKKNDAITFFTVPEYEAWKESRGGVKGYNVKYYKGLGTSTAAEARDYFSKLETHQLDYDLLREGDGDLIDMAFSKKRVEDRKTWLRSLEPGAFVDYGVDALAYKDFVHKELSLFSVADNQRSIPCIVDGLKPSQRKVLFSCFKRKLKREIKVAQLAGYVSEHSAYHHGEASLVGTIIGMAQDFVGSNNLNLLAPCGQFGTRIMGGKDAASPRYIFTRLEPIARLVFHPDDDFVLNYLDDDGQSIEPAYYVPVLPLALCNGADGIGTGWATSVPNYDPRALVGVLKRMIAAVGADVEDEENALLTCKAEDIGADGLAPSYRGFQGAVNMKKEGSYQSLGKIERVSDTQVCIDELPLKKWTHDYKQWLEAQMSGDDKTTAWVKDFKENHTDTTVSFTITVTSGAALDEAEKAAGGLTKKFKLESSMATTNMNFFSEDGLVIERYATPFDICRAFYKVRLETYVKRKAHLVKAKKGQVNVLRNKVRFILAVLAEDIIVHNRKRADLLKQLVDEAFDAIYPENLKAKAKKAKAAADDDASDNDDEDDEAGAAIDNAQEKNLARGYDYLLSMRIWALTRERVDAMRAELKEKDAELRELQATPETDIWLKDLAALEEELDVVDAVREASELDAAKKARAHSNKPKGKKGAKARKPKKKKGYDSDDDSDEDMSSGSEFESAPKKKAPVVKKAPAPPKPAAKPNPFAAKAPAKAAPVAKVAAAPKPAAVKAAPKPKPAPKPAPKKKVASFDSDEEESDGDEFDDDEETVVTAPVVPRAASKRAVSKKTYQVDSDGDDSDEEDSFSIGGDDDMDDDDDVVAPAPKKAAAKAAAKPAPVAPKTAKGKKRAPRAADDSPGACVFSPVAPSPGVVKAKKTKKVLDSDDDDDDDDDVYAAVAAAPRAGRGAAKATDYAAVAGGGASDSGEDEWDDGAGSDFSDED